MKARGKRKRKATTEEKEEKIMGKRGEENKMKKLRKGKAKTEEKEK